ncbi:glycosyltransferase [Nocardioides marmoriginsengisoli]|uniref:Glycosyltransferase n=1 Tax=Nocardioides marmoriginsengisoli TaxID=661483 RepID=A0A3N0CG79_9ACTN|nr:CDP-glycerol glycerophosphotransferase family protein [Nocardioides marmoriginsengisoli]RNL62231.1 glycosyltransferase [Nocardioides marmoriginsengisoli]
MPASPSTTQRVLGFARNRAGRRLKSGVRRLGGRPLVAWERRRQRPELTVVMPVYNVEAYLREALDSALTQSLHNLELIAVDDGSTDSCLEILRDYERRDSRVRVFTQANAGQGSARNVGVAAARAEFLTFMDSDDTIPPQAFAHMVAMLRKSGSDFCVGGVRRFRHRQYMRTTWQRTVHQIDRIGTTIDEFPAAMQDIIACNRVFRTSFWRERVGDFRGGIAYEDHVPMLAAYVRAEKFDILSQITYNWRIRDDSTGHQKARIQNLLDRIEVKEEAHAMLRAEASEQTYDVWVARCLEVDFGPFVAQALDADDTYRATLSEVYRTFSTRATDRAWDLVRVFPKVRAHLVAAERWDDVDTATQYFLSVHQVPPTRVVDGSLVAILPDDEDWAVGLPEHLHRMATLESHFEGAVQRLTWHPGATPEVELTGWMRHRGLDVTDATPEMTLALRSGDTEIPLAFAHETFGEANLWAPLPYAGCATAGFRVRIPLADLAPGQPWSLHGSITGEGITSSGTFHYPIMGSSAEEPLPRDVEIDGARLGVRPEWDPSLGFTFRLRAGGLKHPPAVPKGPLVEDVAITADEIVLTFSSATAAQLRKATLGNARTTLELVGSTDTVARFSTVTQEFGSTPHTAPSADYVLKVDGKGPHPSADFAGSLPVRLLDDGRALNVTFGKKVPLRFTLAPPLEADELGRYNQFRLHAAYRAGTPALTDSFLLASYLGEFATDSQLAIDRHLAATRPDITRIWGVADSSTLVPQGAERVVIGSAAWYDAIARSRYLSKNIDFGPWFRIKPGQAYLQTFHGYPFKTMGLDFWRSKAFTPGQIKHAVAKANEEWDLILVPSAECEAYYREQYLYEGAVLVAGYPRTDILVNADAAAVRSTVLARIGVPEEKTVVLYAPTYRDTLTTKTYAASRFDELDLKQLTDSLGPEYVVLVRGHNNNQREDERVARAGSVVDVTDYPDINELTLAADAAILDYSSLRFDWAITGKPMVFFVPDRDTYFGLRPPLFSFEDSAPGPLLTTTAEVAEALSRPDVLRTEYADQVAAFNQRFNGLHDGRATERVLATLLDDSMPWRQT